MTDKTEDPRPPAERIVHAAIICIEQHGIEATGIRDIARVAGVNSAAINYYFRSKENLIAVALEQTLDQAFANPIEDLDRLVAKGHSVREALTLVWEEQIPRVRQYPRIAYAHMRELLVDQRYDGPATKRINVYLEALFARVRPEVKEKSDEALRIALVQVSSSLLFMALTPQAFDGFLAISWDDPSKPRAYVEQLVQHVFQP